MKTKLLKKWQDGTLSNGHFEYLDNAFVDGRLQRLCNANDLIGYRHALRYRLSYAKRFEHRRMTHSTRRYLSLISLVDMMDRTERKINDVKE